MNKQFDVYPYFYSSLSPQNIKSNSMKIFILNCFLLINLFVGFSASVQKKSVLAEVAIEPRIRVIVDNDFGGDPDGLFQLVHQVLSNHTYDSYSCNNF